MIDGDAADARCISNGQLNDDFLGTAVQVCATDPAALVPARGGPVELAPDGVHCNSAERRLSAEIADRVNRRRAGKAGRPFLDIGVRAAVEVDILGYI